MRSVYSSIGANRFQSLAQGDVAAALAGARDAEAAFRARNSDSGTCVAMLNQTAYLFALGALDDVWVSAREGSRTRVEIVDVRTYRDLTLCGQRPKSAMPHEPARLLGYADEDYRRSSSTREPTEQHEYERALEPIAARLSPERVRALLDEGAAMDVESAEAEARAISQPHGAHASLSAQNGRLKVLIAATDDAKAILDEHERSIDALQRAYPDGRAPEPAT